MHAEGWIALAVLAAASILFYKKWIPFEVTALSLPLVLFATGLIDEPREVLRGFSSDAVITLAAVFVIGAGLQESGVTSLIARLLQRVGGTDELRLSVVMMIVACVLSAFMPNAAAVAVLLPAAVIVSRKTQVPPSRLLIPLSFAAVLGGNLTLLGATPNLLVADAAHREGASIGMFDFLWVGLPMAVAGVAFMATVGRSMLPRRKPEDRLREALQPEAAAREYGLTRTLFRMKILPKSRIVGRTIAESGLRARYGLAAVAVVREGRLRRQFLEPRPDMFLAAGDEIYVEGEDEAAWRLAEEEVVQFGLAGPEDIELILGRGLTLAEVTVPPRSGAVGRTLRDVGFRARFGLNVLSLWRRGKSLRDNVAEIPLEPGDAFLVSGKAQRLQGLARDPDWVVLTEQGIVEDASRAPWALAFLLVALVPPSLDLVPPSLSALAAALLMVTSRCVSLKAAQHAIDWKVLYLVIGILPMGDALQKHGVATLVSRSLVAVTEALGPAALLGTIFVLASLIAMATTNTTSAVLAAPVALAAAHQAGIDPERALLAVAYGASCAFVLPVHQCNIQVMGPGGYVPRDFVRTGLALTVVVTIVAIAVLTWT